MKGFVIPALQVECWIINKFILE